LPQNKLGKGTAPAYKLIREVSPTLEADRELYYDIEKVSALVATKLVFESKNAN